MSQPKLYLFVGFPGAGKTTVAQLIAEATGAVHLWADRERQAMFGKPELNEEEIGEFYARLNQETENWLAAGKSVVFDTNFNYRRDREHLRDLAAKHNAATVIIWLTTPVEIARLRAVEAIGEHEDTRVWGTMTPESFERLSGRLEAPGDDEQPIKINGVNVDPTAIRRQFAA